MCVCVFFLLLLFVVLIIGTDLAVAFIYEWLGARTPPQSSLPECDAELIRRGNVQFCLTPRCDGLDSFFPLCF